MINSSTIRNCRVPFPVVEGLFNSNTLGKLYIKNIYQGWNGENVEQIKQKHEKNPYSVRIGMPSVDETLKADPVYFILHYLSYNPITKDVEKRELIPLRNMDKIYIGQSVDEGIYKNYKLFVDGTAVIDDIHLRKTTGTQSLAQLINNMVDRIEKLQHQVIDLQRQLNSKHIYKQ